VIIPSSNVQRIQEGHITVAHIMCELVEEELYGN
ncbi:MAG: phosphoheptose isomerase, partial [Ignavibacteriaceae bacterium]|nr:phosphoheptose isomerase [Ignavibacteriaceae bacterium]